MSLAINDLALFSEDVEDELKLVVEKCSLSSLDASENHAINIPTRKLQLCSKLLLTQPRILAQLLNYLTAKILPPYGSGTSPQLHTRKLNSYKFHLDELLEVGNNRFWTFHLYTSHH